MKYTIYDPATGEILLNFESEDLLQIQTNLAGKSWIEGHYKSKSYYVQDNKPVEKPPKPQTDNVLHNWNTQSHTWEIDLPGTEDLIRRQRNACLQDLDRINPVWYSSLSPQQQQELQMYRQALLDVPVQSGFPTDISWPAKPTWL
jgi:hypothetical protein